MDQICYWIFMVLGLLMMYGSYQRTFHDAGWGVLEEIQVYVLALPMPTRILLLLLFLAVYSPIVYRAFRYKKK